MSVRMVTIAVTDEQILALEKLIIARDEVEPFDAVCIEHRDDILESILVEASDFLAIWYSEDEPTPEQVAWFKERHPNTNLKEGE